MPVTTNAAIFLATAVAVVAAAAPHSSTAVELKFARFKLEYDKRYSSRSSFKGGIQQRQPLPTATRRRGSKIFRRAGGLPEVAIKLGAQRRPRPPRSA